LFYQASPVRLNAVLPNQISDQLGSNGSKNSVNRYGVLIGLRGALSGSLAFILAGPALAADLPMPKSGGGSTEVAQETSFRRDTGPVPGPARGAGLECLGRVRLRRSNEIGGSRWGVSCHWIADEHPLAVEARLDQLASLGVKWALLVPEWDRIEREKGKYDWNTPSHCFDDVVQGLTGCKIRPIIQIYGGNRLYMPAAADPSKRQFRLGILHRCLHTKERRTRWRVA
jgi:hypothetical protein